MQHKVHILIFGFLFLLGILGVLFGIDMIMQYSSNGGELTAIQMVVAFIPTLLIWGMIPIIYVRTKALKDKREYCMQYGRKVPAVIVEVDAPWWLLDSYLCYFRVKELNGEKEYRSELSSSSLWEGYEEQGFVYVDQQNPEKYWVDVASFRKKK